MSLNNVVPLYPNPTSNEPEKISIDNPLKERFKSDQYRIEQPYMQITAEGYTIHSADNSETYQANRPRHIFHTFCARALGWIAGLAAGVAVFYLFAHRLGDMDKEATLTAVLAISSFIFGFLGGAFIYFAVSKFVGPIRRATIKDSAGATLMIIEPTSRYFIINSEFAIRDARGKLLATFRKDFLPSLFQKRWNARDESGKYLFTAIEDNLLLSVLRRYLNLVRFIPMHFMFTKGGGKPFGEFRRGYSLRDKYKLVYNPKAADGWLMVASGILLDTGENR